MATTPQYRRKLIEVALPLEAINKESAHEKMPGIGAHPRGIHHWWSRKPLTTCRAVIFASLVDDPSALPEDFPTEEMQKIERERLFKIIEELVIWKNSNNESVLIKAQTEIAKSLSKRYGENVPNDVEAIRKYISEKAPHVLDPFCGMGFIPLEAQRLGLTTYASDLNPVAALIAKSLIEIPQKFAENPPINPASRLNESMNVKWERSTGLAEDVRYYSQWMNEEAKKRIGYLYPKIKITEKMAEDRPDLRLSIGKELKVISWIWARTVASPNPAIKGVHVPLTSKFWISTKKGRDAWVEPVINQTANSYQFIVRTSKPPENFNPKFGTVLNKNQGLLPKGARCLISGERIPFEYIREEGKAGRLGSKLMAIVVEGERKRIYLSPTDEQEKIASQARPQDYPDTNLPEQALSMRVQLYGMDKHYKLFTPRQLVAITTFSNLINEVREVVLTDAKAMRSLPSDSRRLDDGGAGDIAYADAVVTYLAFVIDRCVDFNNILARWVPNNEKVMNLFARQALPMVWDYAEANCLENVVGGFPSCAGYIADCIDVLPTTHVQGYSKQLDATANLNLTRAPLISTDPPYYDNIGYADLSDFFYIWLRRSLSSTYPSIFATVLTPKKQELIATPYRHEESREKAKKFFEDGLGRAFTRMHESGNPDFPLTVYYAFKQSETDDGDDESQAINQTASTGWETMLNGLIKSGFTIQGTWPMRSEQSERIVAAGTNALASSIVFVCRPRPTNAPLATRREFIIALKQELPPALKTLQQSSIAPVDLAQAAIGPGMAVFTRFSKVMESDGSPMTVRTSLALINQTLDEVLAEQEGEFDADTRWAIAWFEQFGMNEGAYGTAEILSKAKNTAVNALVEDRLIIAKAGKVNLVARNELPEDWDPTTDRRLTAWESTQYLIRALEQNGENGAADLLKKLGSGMGEIARDLAYRLYIICDRKKWTTEALSYNGLITSWSEIQNLVHVSEREKIGQQTLTDKGE